MLSRTHRSLPQPGNLRRVDCSHANRRHLSPIWIVPLGGGLQQPGPPLEQVELAAQPGRFEPPFQPALLFLARAAAVSLENPPANSKPAAVFWIWILTTPAQTSPE